MFESYEMKTVQIIKVINICYELKVFPLYVIIFIALIDT